MIEFQHDSELPSELCLDQTCEDHHPECAWDAADGVACSGRGLNRIGGRAWCGKHTAELEKQIAALTNVGFVHKHAPLSWTDEGWRCDVCGEAPVVIEP